VRTLGSKTACCRRWDRFKPTRERLIFCNAGVISESQIKPLEQMFRVRVIKMLVEEGLSQKH